MIDVREELWIVDEEDGHVDAQHVVVALLPVELDAHAAHLAEHCVRTAALAHLRGETYGHSGSLSGLEHRGNGVLTDQRVGGMEHSVVRVPLGVDNSLGYALSVEVTQVADNEIFIEQRTPLQ